MAASAFCFSHSTSLTAHPPQKTLSFTTVPALYPVGPSCHCEPQAWPPTVLWRHFTSLPLSFTCLPLGQILLTSLTLFLLFKGVVFQRQNAIVLIRTPRQHFSSMGIEEGEIGSLRSWTQPLLAICSLGPNLSLYSSPSHLHFPSLLCNLMN